MFKYFNIGSFVACACVLCDGAWGNVLNVDSTWNIPQGAIVDADTVNVTKGLRINNNGVINSDIWLCNDCGVEIKNAGVVNGAIYAGLNSRLTQIIESDRDTNKINTDFEFEILVRNVTGISLNSVLDIMDDKAVLLLDGSVVNLTPNVVNKSAYVQLIGTNRLVIDSVDAWDLDVPVLTNVSDNGRLIIEVNNNSDALYIVGTRIDGRALYITKTRQTNYENVFGDDVGEFLDTLRATNSDDALLGALDRAGDISAMRDIMARSVKLNAGLLMRPIRTFNNFMLNSYSVDSICSSAGAGVARIKSRDFGISAINGGGGFNVDSGVDMGVSVYAGNLTYIDDINAYSGFIYGGNLSVLYSDESIIWRNVVGVTVASFDVGDVFNDGRVVNNPTGIAGYLTSDVATDIVNLDAIYFRPVVGLGLGYDSILNYSDTDINARAGFDTGIKFTEFDINYDVGLVVRVVTGGVMSAAVRMGAGMPADNVNADIIVGAIYDDMGFGYRLELNARYVF